jgi:hypothetical protein
MRGTKQPNDETRACITYFGHARDELRRRAKSETLGLDKVEHVIRETMEATRPVEDCGELYREIVAIAEIAVSNPSPDNDYHHQLVTSIDRYLLEKCQVEKSTTFSRLAAVKRTAEIYAKDYGGQPGDPSRVDERVRALLWNEEEALMQELVEQYQQEEEEEDLTD